MCPPSATLAARRSSRRSPFYLFALRGSLPFSEATPQDQLLQTVRDGAPRLAAEAIGTPFGDYIAVLLRRSNGYRFASALEAWNAFGSLGGTLGA